MAKYLPHGTTVSLNAIPIGGLISVTTPDRSRGDAETTDSSSAGDRSYIPGLREGGTIEMSFRHDPADAGQLALETNYGLDGSGAVKSCVITLPVSAKNPARTYTFNAYVISPPKGELGLVDDDVAVQTATIKVAGPVTIA
jgi:hypothetical protein